MQLYHVAMTDFHSSAAAVAVKSYYTGRQTVDVVFATARMKTAHPLQAEPTRRRLCRRSQFGKGNERPECGKAPASAGGPPRSAVNRGLVHRSERAETMAVGDREFPEPSPLRHYLHAMSSA